MYLSQSFLAFATAILILQPALSAPSSLSRRDDSGQILTTACSGLHIDGPRLIANNCSAPNVDDVLSDVNLNQCIANDNGQMVWRWE